MKEFIERLNRLSRIGRNDVIEKDYHLHRLLKRISLNDKLNQYLAFKGGTCLMKAYLNYYRFSEDLDFTWANPDIWADKTSTKGKTACSATIDILLPEFIAICEELGLTFTGDKKNPDEVHISSGGRMVSFKLGYRSEILNIKSSIKVEINFLEELLYPIEIRDIRSYITGIESEELEFLFKEYWDEYNTNIEILCYDPKEIFIEKCRAAITRRVFKLRDLIDIYYIEKGFGYSIGSFENEIKKKTHRVLDIYGRYRENIDISNRLPDDFDESEEMKLLLVEPPKDLDLELKRIDKELDALRVEIVSERK